MRVIGILLAAGRGRRMGGNKQFHLVQTESGEKPLVGAAFDTIAHACEQMIVVLGHRASEVAATLSPRQFEIVEVDADAPMVASIKTGLHVVFDNSRTATQSGEAASILLQLGDHPALEPATLERLLGVAAANTDKAVMPTFQNDGGHPVLIPLAVAQNILADDCPGGLRQFWINHPELCLRVEVDDYGVVQDIDSLLPRD